MNSELKKQILESLKLVDEMFRAFKGMSDYPPDKVTVDVKARNKFPATIAAVEAEPDSDERDLQIVRATKDACIKLTSTYAIVAGDELDDRIANLNPAEILDSLKGKAK
jgi:hypothetical protein